MPTDWDSAAVAKAISDRIAELGMKQKVIAERAQISPATLRSIQNNYQKHRPTSDTFIRLSKALGFKPGYLQDVADGLHNPTEDVPSDPKQTESGKPAPKFALDTLAERLSKLDTIERNLNDLAAVVREIDRKLGQITIDVQYLVGDPQD